MAPRPARELVPIGATREQAIRAPDSDSWYHAICLYKTTISQVFFFGSRHWDKAELVDVGSGPVGDEFLLYDLSSFDEPNAWHTAYARCVSLSRFEE